MALKVIHIDRQALNREAKAKALWENVLKPKLERRARERGGKLMMILKTKENALRQEFSFNKETSKPGEILEIVIEVDGNKLNIRHRTKKIIENSHQKSDQISDLKIPFDGQIALLNY